MGLGFRVVRFKGLELRGLGRYDPHIWGKFWDDLGYRLEGCTRFT